jgi:hypothetical protein
VRETYEERHKAQTVSEMADFMKKFKHSQQEHSLLHVHINLAEKVAEETRSVALRRRLEAEQARQSGAQFSFLSSDFRNSNVQLSRFFAKFSIKFFRNS